MGHLMIPLINVIIKHIEHVPIFLENIIQKYTTFSKAKYLKLSHLYMSYSLYSLYKVQFLFWVI